MRKRGLILKSTLSHFKGYTKYCGYRIWCKTGDYSNTLVKFAHPKKL